MIDMMLDKEIKANGNNYSLDITSRLIFFVYVNKWCKEKELPFAISRKHIAKELGLSLKTIMRIMPKLVDLGLIMACKKTTKTWLYHGHPSFTVGDSNFEANMVEFAEPEDINMLPLEEATIPAKDANHYVYVCLSNGNPVYVGKGKNDRINHCLSGISSNAGLNKLYLTGLTKMTVQKVQEGLTNEEALVKEADLIKSFRAIGVDLLNKQ